MLSGTEAFSTAEVLLDRMGEVAVAAAVLHAQQAQARGRHQAAADWYRIAESALSCLASGSQEDSTVAARIPSAFWRTA